MSSSIQVAIKVRPLIKREIEENLPIQWMVQDKYIGPLDPELKKRGEVGFSFDHIFDTDTTNHDVFDTVAKPIVEAAVTGFNGTIFAYGQTSSGKTFTMMGTNKILGVIPLAVTHIFDLINQSDREFLLRVSYIEIYNEKVNDLLNVEGTDLKITDDQRTGQAKVNCQEEVVNCPENVLTIVKKGNKNRRIGETNMNERSSRSHTILRITIESRLASADASEAVQVSQLNLVDLAGSERSGQTGAIGTRFKEGTHINMSLSTLGLVIKQLSETQDNSKAFVNFRDSKLTRILRCSLGGNAMTTIICAVTPAAFEETQCTLAFASRAKRIQNKPKVNEELSEAALLKRYARQITKLETELQKANSINVVAMESKLLEKERANQILADRIELLKNSILCGNCPTEKEKKGAQGMEKRRRTWCGTSGPVPKFSMSHDIVNLPTIEEFENTSDSEKEQCTSRGKRGRSIIIKDVDIANQSFQTEFTDFELELIERERERENDRLSVGSESDDDYVIKKRTARAVTFRENVSICSDERQSLESNGEPKSPEQSHREPKLGETPKVALRRRIKFLMEQYNSLSEENGNLMEFTKLEKQMIVDEEIAKAMTVHNEKLAASEQMFSELNAKYTTLQKHSENTDRLLAESNDHITEFERQMSESTESLRALRREKQALVEELMKLRGRNSTVQSSVTNDDENETSSIFENDSYFENMNASVVQTDSIFTGDTTNNQTSQDLTMYDSNLANITANTTVTSDVRELKLLAEQLSETVQQLTIENADLSNKLANEKESADRKQKNLEDTIAELLTKIHAITEEKNLLRNSLSEFAKKSERFSGTSSNIVTDDEAAKLINNFKDTIASLTAENEELSSSLMDKIEELERAKDLNISPKDHMCVYRELSNNLGERNKLLENENIDLSNNLMEKIVDYDRIKEQLDAANSTLSSLTSLPQCNKLIEISMNNSNIMDREITTNIGDILRPTFGANDPNRVNITNQRTNGEVSKDHVFLSITDDDKSICDNNENVVKGASAGTDKEFNGLEIGEPTIDELLEESIVSSDTPRETVARDDTSDAWRIKAEMLAERVNELQRLNIKLKDLKLTNCKQCAHLTDLNDDRRALRNEVRQTSVKVREANMKLRELQEKFDREYAHGELLRTKLNEDFDISVSDSTMNESSILDGTFSVSVVEERVQRLRNELDVLTEQHGKLTNDYNEKCNEIEKLQEAGSREATPSPSSNDSTRVKRKDAKIDKIQIDMEDTKTYLRRLKRDISGVRGALNKFESEKASLRNEIERLKAEKLELEEKSASIADSSIAEDKVVTMKKEIERLREAIDGFDGIKNELENANASLEDRLRNSEIERTIFAKQTADYDDSADGDEKIKKLLIDLTRLKEQIEILKNDNKELRDGKSVLQAEFDFVTSRKIVVEKDFDELTRSLDNLEKENSILKSELEKLRLENDEKNENRLTKIPQNDDSTTVESLKLRIKEANDEITKHVERNEQLEERLRKILTAENEVEDLKSQLKNVNEDFNEIAAENANLKEKLMKSENSEEHSSTLESLELRIKEANDEITKHVERNEELEERLRKILTAENEVEDLKSQLKSVNGNFNEIATENANLKEKLMKFENSEEHSSILESLELRIKEANDEITKHVERNEELEERLRKILTAENEVEDLKSQLKSVNENFNEIVAENANLKEKFMKSENSEEHSSVLKSFELRIKEANDEVKRHVERNAELEERLRKILTTENEVDDLQSQLKKVTERLDEIVAKNASLEEKLTKFENSENDSSRDSKSSLNNEEIVGNERKTCEIDNSYLLENEKTIEALNLRVREITIELERYAAENAELNKKIIELNEALEKRSENFVDTDSPIISELRKEVNSARESITREIKSLKPTIDCKDFTVSDLFVAFMREIISKEKELMRNLVANSEREKRELKESKRQSDDAEKRAKSWAKELEAENERIQQNLIANGAKNAELNTEISRLTNLLMESNHENEMLKEKMKVLELDFNTLQAELETLTGTKSNATQQEKERLIEEALATQELELNSKFRLAAKQYKEKIDELTSNLEFKKIRNLELTNNFEAIEINEKRLKNIADTKSAEVTMCNTTIERMEKELKNLTDKHEELSRKSDEKSRKIEEITSLLKNKCDMLSEYKTKLETITPEYENLKDQAAERQKRLEIYKKEIECMTNENATALSSLREKLNSEKIKSSGYRKELIELTNKNVTLQTEIDELRSKCEDLEISNGKMAKSLRNSTSKIRAEEEMKELRESNKTLQSNLDGAANRIIELQETKTQLTNDLAELRRSREVLLANNAEMINTIATLKSSVDDASEMREKYKILATERDYLALEIEKKQSIIEEIQQSYENCKKENEKLVLQNKELDEEMDDIVNKIHELSGENAVLEDKLYTITTEQESQVIERIANAEIQRLKSQIEELEGQRDRLHCEIRNAIDDANNLTTENHKLREQISNLERRNSSCSNCATVDRQKRDSRRRRSRTELFDQKRQIDDVEITAAAEGSRCVELENKVRELEIELVTKKGQLAALQVKILSEERPHKEAADELRQMYRAAREKILTQTAELQKLRDLTAKLSTECEKCKNWSENHADKSTQCLPEPLRLRLGTLGCGCDSDYAKNVPESEKLKRAQKFIESLKDVCRKHLNTISRQRREITLLEKRLNNEPLTADERRQESPASTIVE